MEELKLNWYAVKVFFNKVFEMEDRLEGMGLESYIAIEKVMLKGNEHLLAARHLAQSAQEGRKDRRFIQEGAVIYARRPLVASLIFVHANAQDILEVDAMLKENQEFTGQVKGFIYKNPERKDFCAIPDKQMTMFKLVTGSGVGGLKFFADDDITRFKEGDRVRVKEGPLRGAEGYIKRVNKNRRLLVCIEGIIAVATSYIPPHLLEVVNK